MTDSKLSGTYSDADAYERFMGQWSRASGLGFVAWLELPAELDWLDVGCGTGAFTQVIVETCDPRAVTAVDPSDAQIAYARSQHVDPRIAFRVGDGQSLDFPRAAFDVAVAALVLNFVPDPDAMIAEMKRVSLPGGTVAAYLWDFDGGRNVSQHIWEGVAATDPDAPVLRQGAARVRMSRLDSLARMFERASLEDVDTNAIDLQVEYRDFDDYWDANDSPVNPIGQYIGSLPADRHELLKRTVEAIVPRSGDGRIVYTARVHAVRGAVPQG